MKAQTIWVVSFLSCGGALAFAGCGMQTDGGGALGGSSRSGGFATVTVGAGTAPVGDTSGVGSTVAGGSSGMLGAACSKDGDCGEVLSCLGPDGDDATFGGGAAGGVCTRYCAADVDCPGMNAVCLKAAGAATGRCTLSCALGPPLDRDYGKALDPSKCQGRPDLRCEKVKGVGAVCLPTCGSDAQCGEGRVCDGRSGACVGAKVDGLPTGASCDAAKEPTACAGRCVSFELGTASCSSPCVLGGDLLDAPDCGGPTKGLCAFGPADNGAGDLGYCTQSCKAHSDCQGPVFWCFGVQGLTEKLGNGYCFGAAPCKTQSDCDALEANSPYVCTPTPSGSHCLDKAFPFGKGVGLAPL